MKRLIAVISGLLVLPAFAEIAPAYYYEEMMAQYADQMPESDMAVAETDAESVDDADASDEVAKTPVVPTAVSPRNSNGRAAASRAVATAGTTSGRNVASRTGTNQNIARTVSTRGTTVTAGRTTTTTPSRSAVARTTGTRTTRGNASTTVASRPTTTVRSASVQTTQQTPGVTSRNSTKSGGNTARASIVQTDTVNSPLYISSRIGVSNTSNVSTRVPTIRVGSATTSSTTTATETTSATTTASIDELAQLTDYCKAQYVACMDNFCNVLDDNQGRCSCSANLSNYAETEEALKQATEDLQDVALQIQYIGLTADEVETLFTQTEAELEMQTSSDNSQLRNDLDKIKNMIIDVKSGTPSSDASMQFDLSGLLEFTIDSTGFDLSTLFGLSNQNDSISNQRGEQLYKTATARCKAAVLNSCAAQGVDTSIITNSYDLEIDKACIAYERSLTDSNEQMSSTVRNAKAVLQRARLLVAQQKNTYDLRGCVNALDTCMQDDFVCGDDYENCLDPTGKYIVNGDVVVGSKPGAPGYDDAPIYDTWDYTDESTSKNAWGMGAEGDLSGYIAATVKESAPVATSVNMSEFLQNKIGYHDDDTGRDFGMCMSVLNRCQDVTYTGTGQNKKYNPTNNVIKEFLNRTLVQIKSSQDTILADYAENCILDVASCLAQNNYDEDENTGDTLSSGNKLAIKACNPIITSCMSVNDVDGVASTEDLTADEWIMQIMDD